MAAPIVLNVSTPITPLIFDQGSNSVIEWTYSETTNISAWGGRMALYVDATAVLLSLTTTVGGGNGALILSATAPNIQATIAATDTLSGQAIAAFQTGSWYLFLDPAGAPDASSFKAFGGWWMMNPLVVD